MSQAAQLLDTYHHDVRQLLDTARRVQQQIQAAQATVRSTDGLITVTVGAHGALSGVTLAAGCQELAPDQLAQLMMTTVSLAREKITGQLRDSITPLVGATTARAVIPDHGHRGTTEHQDVLSPNPVSADESVLW